MATTAIHTPRTSFCKMYYTCNQTSHPPTALNKLVPFSLLFFSSLLTPTSSTSSSLLLLYCVRKFTRQVQSAERPAAKHTVPCVRQHKHARKKTQSFKWNFITISFESSKERYDEHRNHFTRRSDSSWFFLHRTPHHPLLPGSAGWSRPNWGSVQYQMFSLLITTKITLFLSQSLILLI